MRTLLIFVIAFGIVACQKHQRKKADNPVFIPSGKPGAVSHIPGSPMSQVSKQIKIMAYMGNDSAVAQLRSSSQTAASKPLS